MRHVLLLGLRQRVCVGKTHHSRGPGEICRCCTPHEHSWHALCSSDARNQLVCLFEQPL